MYFTFKKNNKQTKKPVNRFLQDDANAGVRSLQTSIEIKLPKSTERTFTLPKISIHVKFVQSALSDLLTTSATHGTFSRPSTKRGLISIGLELNTNARELFGHC